MRRAAAIVFVLLLFGSCVRDAGNLTESGQGFPRLTADIAPEVEAGAEITATLTVDNPGPGDMDSVVVAFAPIGPAQGESELPNPLVGVSVDEGSNPSVLDVSPDPDGVGQGGVIYRFGSLAEGESIQITFNLKAPVIPGTAANSVQVYDGADVSRARGVRLQTLVER